MLCKLCVYERLPPYASVKSLSPIKTTKRDQVTQSLLPGCAAENLQKLLTSFLISGFITASVKDYSGNETHTHPHENCTKKTQSQIGGFCYLRAIPPEVRLSWTYLFNGCGYLWVTIHLCHNLQIKFPDFSVMKDVHISPLCFHNDVCIKINLVTLLYDYLMVCFSPSTVS